MRTALDADPAQLDEQEQRFVEQIREHGWFGMHVMSGAEGPGFSYTTGFWLKFLFPELIVFSLPQRIAHDTFWHIYRLLETGRRFPMGERIEDIFKNTAAVLLAVSRQQYRPRLGWSRWFYGSNDFECVQLIFPDPSGHFPWSAGSSDRIRATQPDLTAGNWSGLHDNLRHASSTDKMTWPFDDPPDVAVFTTKSIVFGRQPVLLVSHDEKDGAWQFLPREGACHVKDAALVGLREMIERDGTLAELADLPVGWRAWRKSPDSPWLRKRSTDASSGT
jgi:hypothetical protein